MIQSEGTNFDSGELEQNSEALEGLLNLLVELQIIESSGTPKSESADSGNSKCAEVSVPTALNSVLVSKPEAAETSKFQISQFVPLQGIVEPEKQYELRASNLKKPDLSQSDDQFIAEDTIAALERLQTLLVKPELVEIRPLVETLEQKLANLEYQIYEPTELINLLLPWIAELLNRKVVESREEVIQAIAPIIDKAIENRVEQDKAAMGAALAPVIATAIAQQINHAPEEIATAIAPTMGKAIKEQINLEKDAMVDALYPIIGSTIAKYMAEAIQTINQKIENTFSIEGIQRKIRAKVQGVSEAELILKEAMPFTVQAIFLIHKASGLVIANKQPETDQRLESEMVAGMLTAIRSFVNDCIEQSGTVSELDQIDYGNSKIILEVAGYCYLATVVQGEPPRQFILKMRQTLGTLVQQHGRVIETFEGDLRAVPNEIDSTLERLRQTFTPAKERKGTQSKVLLVAGLGLLTAIMIPWGICLHQNSHDRQVESDTALALASAPELAVYRLTVEAHRGIVKLAGRVPNQALRRRAERVAQTVAPGWSLDNSIQAVEVPADPVLAAAEIRRATTLLNQTEGILIQTRFADGRVAIDGTINRVADAKTVVQAFERIPGVQSVMSAVQVKPLRIEVRFYFAVASAQMEAADLGSKLRIVQTFLKRHSEKSLKIVGYSNPISSFQENQTLALERAKTLRDALIARGISPDRLQVQGSIHRPAGVDINQPAWLNRCVEVNPVAPVIRSP
jgi:outer membrane protein OmpA-like peptidoglycan-associated protein/phage terminase small subunit